MANTIASSLQQMSMSFGLACGSLIAGWYLGDLPQTAGVAVTAALHHAFLTLGGLTVLSWLSFWFRCARRIGRASAGGACVKRSRACRPLATPAIHPISLF
jgi:predicted MFS family arabinose efflux permease